MWEIAGKQQFKNSKDMQSTPVRLCFYNFQTKRSNSDKVTRYENIVWSPSDTFVMQSSWNRRLTGSPIACEFVIKSISYF